MCDKITVSINDREPSCTYFTELVAVLFYPLSTKPTYLYLDLLDKDTLTALRMFHSSNCKTLNPLFLDQYRFFC